MTGQEEYNAPPPNYPPLGSVDEEGRHIHNLMTNFVDMSSAEVGFGRVMSDIELFKDLRWIESFRHNDGLT